MSELDEIIERTKGHTVSAVATFPGYYISDDGRVFSTQPWRGQNFRELSGTWHHGYLTVRLTSPHGSRHRKTVHSLVATAFLGDRPYGAEIRHLDGDVANNAASNLAYGTKQSNADDRASHGRTSRGDIHAKMIRLGKELAEGRRIATEQREQIRELQQRQAWLDEVARPAHPDDERPWASAYLDAREQIRELRGALKNIIKHQRVVSGSLSFAADMTGASAIARAVLDKCREDT